MSVFTGRWSLHDARHCGQRLPPLLVPDETAPSTSTAGRCTSRSSHVSLWITASTVPLIRAYMRSSKVPSGTICREQLPWGWAGGRGRACRSSGGAAWQWGSTKEGTGSRHRPANAYLQFVPRLLCDGFNEHALHACAGQHTSKQSSARGAYVMLPTRRAGTCAAQHVPPASTAATRSSC